MLRLNSAEHIKPLLYVHQLLEAEYFVVMITGIFEAARYTQLMQTHTVYCQYVGYVTGYERAAKHKNLEDIHSMLCISMTVLCV